MTTHEILTAASAARSAALLLSTEDKNRALFAMADALIDRCDAILTANAADVAAARGTISDVMLDRLSLNPPRIAAMADGLRQVAALPDPVGRGRGRKGVPYPSDSGDRHGAFHRTPSHLPENT